jgi:hypothetical protein
MGAIQKEWTLVTFDMCTAILGDGTTWEVLGQGDVGVYRAEDRKDVPGRRPIRDSASERGGGHPAV